MNDLLIIERGKESIPYHLLLLADPSRKMIDQYLNESEIFLAKSHNSIIGILALRTIGSEGEIMNVAVNESFQGKGIGSQLIQHAIKKSRDDGIKRVLIGTADTSKDQISLYQKLGFTQFDVKADFFIDNYDEPIFENGKHAKDMIMLELLI